MFYVAIGFYGAAYVKGFIQNVPVGRLLPNTPIRHRFVLPLAVTSGEWEIESFSGLLTPSHDRTDKFRAIGTYMAGQSSLITFKNSMPMENK
jgi:hypothetical protein